METLRSFTLDDELWPFVMARASGKPTDEELAEYLPLLKLRMERDEPYLLVVDTSQVQSFTVEQFQQMAAWSKKNKALLDTRILGTGYVISSPFIRLGMNMFMHLSRPVAPYLYSSDLRSVISWSVQRLNEVGKRECAQRVWQRHGLGPRAVAR